MANSQFQHFDKNSDEWSKLLKHLMSQLWSRVAIEGLYGELDAYFLTNNYKTIIDRGAYIGILIWWYGHCKICQSF